MNFKRAIFLFRTRGPFYVLRRVYEKIWRLPVFHWALLYCTYLDVAADEVNPADSIEAICFQRLEDFPGSAITQLLKHRVSDDFRKEFEERFQKGAEVYLAFDSGQCVGFLWTTEDEKFNYFFPFRKGDCYIFDVEIFSDFRGRNYFPRFLNAVIRRLREKGLKFVFYAVYQWNIPMIRSTQKTILRPFGRAKRMRLPGGHGVLFKPLEKPETDKKPS